MTEINDPLGIAEREEASRLERLPQWARERIESLSSELVEIRLLFTSWPGPESEFVEAETLDGAGIRVGVWEQHGEYAALRLKVAKNNEGAL